MASGIYIVRLLNKKPMPVTRDARYVDVCAKVNRSNIKVGKAKNLNLRAKNYFKDFDEHNVIFEVIVELEDTQLAERAILKSLDKYRKRSPKGRKLEWLEGVTYKEVKEIVLSTLQNEGLKPKSKLNFVLTLDVLKKLLRCFKLFR